MIMAMMKSSNTEWLGDIPAEWDVAQIGNYYELRNEKVSDYDFEPLSVTMKGIVPQLATAAKSDDHSNRKLVKKGDFVINSRSDRRGSCGISPLDGSVSLINTVMEPRGEMNPQYYNWLFHTEQFADEFYKWGHGIVDDLWTTRWQEMKKILIVAPSPDEQQAIADYLDETCSKIDEIIAEAKASIDEYKELKQSILCDAVLRGLNSQVVLKNSGALWIGMIPEHWQTAKLKWHLRRMDPKNPGEKEVLSLYRDYGVIPKNSRTDNHNVTSEDTSKYKYVRIGDFVVNKMKAWQGSVAVSDYEGIVSPAYYVYHFLDDVFNKRYFHHLLRSCYKEEFMRLSGGIRTGQWDLSSNNLDNIILLVPPKNEQDNIVEYLDNRLPQIDSLIAEKESLINDLDAYKKSLIYEVVTGKRRVV